MAKKRGKARRTRPRKNKRKGRKQKNGRARKSKASSKDTSRDVMQRTDGMDYGIRPAVMAYAGACLPESWAKAESVAASTVVIPRLQEETNLPAIGPVFKNRGLALELFTMLRSWMEPPGNASAVGISLISDRSAGKYYLCLSADAEQGMIRLLGLDAEKDYLPIVLTTTIALPFPLSGHFQRFAHYAAGKRALFYPVVLKSGVVPQSGKFAISDMGESLFELGFIKDDIRFADFDALKEGDGDRETILATRGEARISRGPPDPPGPPPPKEVAARREANMRRFYSLRVARLHRNESYVAAIQDLKGKYQEWQRIQAACNLVAKEELTTHSPGATTDMIDVFSKSRNTFEDPSARSALDHMFSVTELEDQIAKDVEYLSSALSRGQSATLNELRTRGYL